MYHDTVLGRFLDFGDDDGAFLTMRFMEVGQLGKGIVADDVGVQDEEGRGVFAESFGREFEGAGSTERLGFDGEFNADVVFFFVLEEKGDVSGSLIVFRMFWFERSRWERSVTFFNAATIISGR